jgi:hypothetical protein
MKSKSITRNEKTEVLAEVNYLQFCNKGSYEIRVLYVQNETFGLRNNSVNF